MELHEEKNARVQSLATDKTISFEGNTELSLPDYMGEVSRLLWVRPTVLPPTRFLNGERAEFSGRVRYDVLYKGGDGRLYSADTEDAYSFAVPIEVDGDVQLFATVIPDVVVGRVAAPRRLTVRCRMHAHVCGYTEKNIGVRLPQEMENRVCRLGDMAECGSFYAGMGDAVTVQEEFEVTGDAVRVIASHAEVFLPDVTARQGCVRCRGEVMLSLLCCNEAEHADAVQEGEEHKGTEKPFAVSRRLPFECEVPLEDVYAEYSTCATAVVSEIRTAVEGNRVSAAVRILPVARAQCATPICFTKDLFAPGMQTTCVRAAQKLWTPQLCCNKNYSISGSASLGELGISPEAEVLDITAEAEVREKTAERGNTFLSGELHCHILYHCGEEYGTAEATVPFRVSCEGEFETLQTVASVPVCRANITGDRVRIDAELQLALRAFSALAVSAVSEAEFLPCEERARADLELCYPVSGETLWEVSRQYLIAPEVLAAANGLQAEDSVDLLAPLGGRYLLIPHA